MALPKQGSNGSNAVEHNQYLQLKASLLLFCSHYSVYYYQGRRFILLVRLPHNNMWKAHHNEFNPPVNPKLLFSMDRNTLVRVCSKETIQFFLLTAHTWEVFNGETYFLPLCSLSFTSGPVNIHRNCQGGFKNISIHVSVRLVR